MGESNHALFVSIDSRLEQLRAGQIDLVKQVTEVALHQKDTNSDVANIMAELGGAPDWRSRGSRETIGTRLRKIDADKYAAAKNLEINSKRWSKWQKVSLFMIALVTAVTAILAVLQGSHIF